MDELGFGFRVWMSGSKGWGRTALFEKIEDLGLRVEGLSPLSPVSPWIPLKASEPDTGLKMKELDCGMLAVRLRV